MKSLPAGKRHTGKNPAKLSWITYTAILVSVALIFANAGRVSGVPGAAAPYENEGLTEISYDDEYGIYYAASYIQYHNPDYGAPFNAAASPIASAAASSPAAPVSGAASSVTKSAAGREIKTITLSTSGTLNAGDVMIKNETGLKIDPVSLLAAKVSLSLKGSNAHVLIIHTHTTEAYQPDGSDRYNALEPERTLDNNYNVVRIGDELRKILEANGIKTIHDKEVHDYPSYVDSYNRALQDITAQMKKNPSIRVIIDIHRDSMADKSGVAYKTLTKVNGRNSAQVMLVMGSSAGTLPHPKWQENLKLAMKIQQRVAAKYPDLMRPIDLRAGRFNEHVTAGSMLLEVGTDANTLQEALTAIRAFGPELAAELKQAAS